MTDASADAVAFDQFLAGSRPEVAAIARRVRLTVLAAMPDAVEWFDPSDGVLAFGTTRTMRDMAVAIVPHKAHVNVQFVDGVDLPNPDGRIEGTGKRARHVKVRSVDDATAPWLRAAIAAQVATRTRDGR